MSHRRNFPSRPGRNLARSLRMLLFTALLSFLFPRATPAQMAAPPPSGGAATNVPVVEPPVMDSQIFTHVLFDQLEGRTDGPDNTLRWDAQAWLGTDMNRLWLKSEGFLNDGAVSDGDVEAFYDRPLPRFRYFDGQVGIREDFDSGPRRTWAAVGIEGLAPHFFEIEPTFYFRDGGHLAGRLTAAYDLLITQRLIVQPELELNFYSKRDLQRRLGTGLSDLDTGVRIRYEIRRKLAPYFGFAYTREFGDTAMLLRQIGETTADPRLVFGLRVWY